MAQGAVRHLPGGDDSWAGATPDGLCEAVRPSTPLCPGRSWQRLKNFSERLKEIRAALGEDVEIEVWWQDEARVGQKNKITRAKRGTRPSAPKDQRTTSAYIFICPGKGKAAGLVMPYANTEALNAHLKEIACIVEPGSHAIVMLDQAGWHTSLALEVPDNITLMPLPPRAPELNPVENVVHARQLALQPCLQKLRRHPRSLLPGTILSHSPSGSPQSEHENGPMSSKLCPLV